MRVKPFEPENLEEVFLLQKNAFRPLYLRYHDEGSPYLETRSVLSEKILRPGACGYVFKAGGTIAGFVRVWVGEDGTGKISALAVDPAFQGRGYATQGLTEVMAFHPEVTRWTLDTLADEPALDHLYTKLGFHRTGKLEKVSDTLTLAYYEK